MPDSIREQTERKQTEEKKGRVMRARYVGRGAKRYDEEGMAWHCVSRRVGGNNGTGTLRMIIRDVGRNGQQFRI